MKKTNLSSLFTLMLIATIAAVVACKKDDPKDDPTSPDNYDRAVMLTNMANNYIVPAYSQYLSETETLNNAVDLFSTSPSVSGLNDLRDQWKLALLTWQDVAFLEFGPAESISLRSQTNTYPTDTTIISDNILSGSYDLQIPSNFVAKGFQALDFLLHKPGFTDTQLVDFYVNNSNARMYLVNVVAELKSNAQLVHGQWSSSYGGTFINNNSSNAQGSSVSNLLNALSLHYETYVRKGKIGLPAGVFNGFSQIPLPDRVEAFYHGESLPFAIREMEAINKYLKGENYLTGSNGEGIDDYLIFVGAQSGGQAMFTATDNQINAIVTDLGSLNDPLSNEVTTNVSGVATTYQSMQFLVPTIKVDMCAALGVLVTYQDSDGD